MDNPKSHVYHRTTQWQQSGRKRKIDTHPTYQGGDGSTEPVIDVENQEAAHGDKEALWREDEQQGKHNQSMRVLRVHTADMMQIISSLS